MFRDIVTVEYRESLATEKGSSDRRIVRRKLSESLAVGTFYTVLLLYITSAVLDATKANSAAIDIPALVPTITAAAYTARRGYQILRTFVGKKG